MILKMTSTKLSASVASVEEPLSPKPKILSNGTSEKKANGKVAKVPQNSQESQSASPKRDSKEESKEEKMSGAELKKRAKAEKAARRAQEKQVTEVATAREQPTVKRLELKPDSLRTNSITPGLATPTAKDQHKRAGSTSIHPKNMPLRQVQTHVTPPTELPKKENKNVALFGHLYGHPRRTTIAAAGKDVHPTVLALGLQMSNYVICGSNARSVALLLVFKRVTYSLEIQNHYTIS